MRGNGSGKKENVGGNHLREPEFRFTPTFKTQGLTPSRSMNPRAYLEESPQQVGRILARGDVCFFQFVVGFISYLLC